ncbi:classical arabinogalactan protein 25-like [Cucurbita moschata]|uniref:Classical arabinogalactan protein 25-like n=1 Tax=Cucurbita moschata TaxID=3662 RepID=A0A6J1H4T0_CUCMO|nr:classical arabinogalactan protein 25-like [Cucurbita moschata]
MASFWYCAAVIMALMASPLLALPSLPNPKLSSSFQELSPDIAPLLPSSGGSIPSASGSIPTIPSNPSPPNPDEFEAPGPDSSALSPLGLPGSFAAPKPLPPYSNSLLLLTALSLHAFYLHLH